jgi:hypothetical protein
MFQNKTTCQLYLLGFGSFKEIGCAATSSSSNEVTNLKDRVEYRVDLIMDNHFCADFTIFGRSLPCPIPAPEPERAYVENLLCHCLFKIQLKTDSFFPA